jgi:PAS domain S-box-containing protein
VQPASLRRYGFAVLASAAALAASLLLWPLIKPNNYMLFLGAVAVSAWYGGLGPALSCIVLADVSNAYFFLPAAYSLSVTISTFMRLFTFSFVALLISSLSIGRQRAEEALLESTRRRINVLESITDGFVALDRRWRFTYLNRQAAQLLRGLHRVPEELLGRNIWEEFPNQERSIFYQQYHKAMANQTPLKFESFFPTVKKWFAVNVYPSADGLAIYFDDISERRHAEEQRAKVLADAEAARADAEAANRAKDEFLATLSHELRTPLSAILAWTNLLRMGKLDADTSARALETIERNTKLQAQLIEDLLDVSRIITGKLRLQARPVQLAASVESAIDAVRPTADAKGVDMSCEMEGQVGPVSGDPDRLQQVLWNLLSNAVKFTPQGGRVDVGLRQVGPSAEITVRDTGEGITPEFLPYVFERFRQVDSTAARVHGGLGLGLAIARHLVELHGGSIRAQSPGVGQGATFSVRLPIMAAQARPSSGETPLHPAAAGVFADGVLALEGKRVLVVDDEADARGYLTVALQQCGAEVVTAASAREALDTLQRRSPDVLVSDIGMPGEDGFALIEKVRALDPANGGRVPAVALTAYARHEDRRRVLMAGYDMHLAKPVDPYTLAEAVRRVLQRGQA